MQVLVMFLIIGTVVMLVPISIMAKKEKIALWRSVVATIALTITGTVGTVLMYYFENGNFLGTSFFGAVFFVPLVFAIIAPLLKIPYKIIMDMCAAGECIMLALMKIKCLITGCCTGRIWFYSSNGVPSYYPVREAELVNALLLLAILMYWHKKGRNEGVLYGWYMLLYGVSRFVLNSFRGDLSPFVWILSAGHFWSVCSCTLGAVVLFVLCRKKRKYNTIV